MAVVSMMRMEGNPDELASKILEHVDPVARRLAPAHGGLGTILARTESGVLAINLWKSEQDRHDMAAEPEIQEALEAAGLPAPNFEGFEVLRYEFLPDVLGS
jgi:hypothetical protein